MCHCRPTWDPRPQAPELVSLLLHFMGVTTAIIIDVLIFVSFQFISPIWLLARNICYFLLNVVSEAQNVVIFFWNSLAFPSHHHRTEAEQQECGRFTNMASEWARLITKNTIFFNVPPKLASAWPKSTWASPGRWLKGINTSLDVFLIWRTASLTIV